jgi:hypothetical protein
MAKMRIPVPDPALKRLEKLVGTWKLSGQTPDRKHSVKGKTTIKWAPGGFFMLQHGEIRLGNFKVHSLEIIRYDPRTKVFPGYVFSELSEKPAEYWWDVKGNIVRHWTADAVYTGKFSKNGRVLVGGWRPKNGVKSTPGNTYDTVMIKI